MADRLGVRPLEDFRSDGVGLDGLRSRRRLLKRLALERGGTAGPDRPKFPHRNSPPSR
jgi:hypothetical protein